MLRRRKRRRGRGASGYYNRYAATAPVGNPVPGGTEVSEIISDVERTYAELGPGQVLVNVDGTRSGVSANPTIAGTTVAVAQGTRPVQSYEFTVTNTDANGNSGRLELFDATGIHAAGCGCQDSNELTLTPTMLPCPQYNALKMALLGEDHMADMVRLVATDASGQPVNAGKYTIRIKRANFDGNNSTSNIYISHYIGTDQRNTNMVDVPLGANDPKSVIDKYTKWEISGIGAGETLRISMFIGLVTK